MNNKSSLKLPLLLCYLLEVFFLIVGVVLNLFSNSSVLSTIYAFLYEIVHYFVYAIIFATTLELITLKAKKKAWILSITYILLLYLIDVVGYALDYILQSYTFLDALLLSLMTAAMSTLLVEVLFFGVSLYLVWLIFQSNRPRDLFATDPFQIKGSYSSFAYVFFAILLFVRLFVNETITFVSFGLDTYWMFGVTEVITIFLDYIILTLVSFGSYILMFYYRAKILSKI